MTPFFHFLQNNGLAKAKSMACAALAGEIPAGDTAEDGVFVVAAAAEIENALMPFVSSLNFDSAIGDDRKFVRNSDLLGLCPLCKGTLTHTVDGLWVLCTRHGCHLNDGIPVGAYWELERMLAHVDPVSLAWSMLQEYPAHDDF